MSDTENGPKIVQTDSGAKDGQNKCPKCGATDISLNSKSGLLRCNYCRYEFNPEKLEGMVENISMLQGEVMGSGTQDIVENSQNVVTLKCSSCGAEVVIDTSEATQARCHWCRNTLSINQQIPNGGVPDVVLPFKLTREEAKSEIEKFVGKRKFYAHPVFRKEFSTDNIMGVYFPYMVVDINSHAYFSGQGEHQVRSYVVGSGNSRQTLYDADLYNVERDFDLTIKGLTIESNSDKLNQDAKDKTNNIINSIMPFDTDNCVKWNANYLKGYTSERRDTNVDQLRPIVDQQSRDIARFEANKTLKNYDRGVCWANESLNVKGKQWKTAYLPVWLYSYLQVSGNNKKLHYVAVNARTKETMGSVPVHIPKLILMSVLVEILAFFLFWFVDWDGYEWLLLLAGIIYYFVIYNRYRNKDARHHHETETATNMYNVKQSDRLVKRKTGLSNPKIEGANNMRVGNQILKKDIISSITNFKL